MISLDSSSIPLYLRSSAFWKAVHRDGGTKITIPTSCFKENTSIDSLNDLDRLLHTLHFWVLEDPEFKVLAYIMNNDVSPYQQKNSEKWQLLTSLRFGIEYLQLKELQPEQRIAFVIHNDMSIEIVKHLYYLGCTLPANLCTLAAQLGNPDLLHFAHSQQHAWGDTAKVAVKHGHLDCLRFAVSRGCSVEASLLLVAAESGQLETLTYLATFFRLSPPVCAAAAKNGHLSCLQYAHEQGAGWDAITTDAAAKGGHLNCLVYAHLHGCPLSDTITEIACARGDLVCLQYAIAHGCVFTANACTAAAFHGHLHCLEYAHSQGAHWTADACTMAAQRGHFHVLCYLRVHGCPWDKQAQLNAFFYHHWDCFIYTALYFGPMQDTFTCFTQMSLFYALLVSDFRTYWTIALVLLINCTVNEVEPLQELIVQNNPASNVARKIAWWRAAFKPMLSIACLYSLYANMYRV